MGLIKEILAACDDVTYHYLSSKRPKFIKKITYIRSMKKIDNIINKLSISDITDLVLEYIEVLLETHPPFGRYEHCASVKLLNEKYSACFEYDILKTNRDKYHIIADVFHVSNWFEDNKSPAAILFHIFHNGIKSISFSVNLDDIIPKILDDPNRLEAISAEARLEFTKIIQYDIIQFFKEYQSKCKVKVKVDG